jgi:N-acetylmuramoyl-L-alanine amidase
MFVNEKHILDGMDDPEVVQLVPHFKFKRSPNTTGGTITPKFLVMHFTASHIADHAVDWFMNPSSKVSAHIVLDRDGSITQMVPFNVVGWHVGASYWKGHSGLNSHSIGIEVVNYGFGGGMRDGLVQPRRKGDFDPAKWGKPEDWVHAEHPLEPGRPLYWQRFTEEQLAVLDWLTPMLVDHYRLREVVGHEEVAIPQGRKTDPGPAFPLRYFKQFADFRNGGAEGNYTVVVDDLNMRGGPGPEYTILSKLQRGTVVKVLKHEGKWALITIDNARGYVHESFIMKN